MISDLTIIYDAIKPFIKEKNISLSFDSFVENECAETDIKDICDFLLNTIEIKSLKLKHSGVNNYLAQKFGFNSKTVELIKEYDLLFNANEETTYHLECGYYLTDEGNIKQYQVISLVELQYGGDSQEIIEFNDSDPYTNGVSDAIFEYYKLYFYNDSIPTELVKPIDELVESERSLIRMLLI